MESWVVDAVTSMAATGKQFLSLAQLIDPVFLGPPCFERLPNRF